MSFIKSLFGKKESSQPVEQPKYEFVSTAVNQIAVCGACKQPIFEADKIRSFNKEKYHLECFRSNMKLMRKQVFQT